MKIYAKYTPQYTSQDELSKFVGKDVWVKVAYNSSEIQENVQYWWIKPIEKSRVWWEAYAFEDFMIDDPSGVSLDEDDLNIKEFFERKKLHVVNPMQTMTTDEIYEKYL